MVALGQASWIPWQPQVMIIYTGEGRELSLQVAEEFRRSGIITETDLMDRSFSAQMKAAGKSADFAVIIGKEEMASGMITLKDLKAGTQEKVSVEGAIRQLTSA